MSPIIFLSHKNKNLIIIFFFKIINPFLLCLHVQLLQSCQTLCDSSGVATLCSPTSSSVHGILQARMLEWVAMPSSRWSFQPRDWTCISCTEGGFFTTEPPRKLHFLLSWSKCEDNMWSWFRWGNDKGGHFSGTITLCLLLLFRNYVMSDSLWPMNCSPPGSSVHGVSQARILKCVTISFSRGSSQPRDWTCLLHWQADSLLGL